MRVKLFLSRLVFRKPYNRPLGEGNTPPLVPTAPPFPRRGHGPTDLSLVFKIITCIRCNQKKSLF